MKKALFACCATLSLLYGAKEVHIDLTNQVGYAMDNGEVVFEGKISSGKLGMETPTGNFKIMQKKEAHVSNLWPKPDGGAKMPYMMRLNWSPIAMHAGHVPDYPASHGCIRLETKFAINVFNWAEIGTKVYVNGKAEAKPAYKKKVVQKARRNKKASKKKNYSAQRQREDEEMERSFDVMGYYAEDIPRAVENW